MESEKQHPAIIPQDGGVTPMQMLHMAVSQGADLDRMERLMQLQERWEANEARKAFNMALGRFKMKGIVVGKDAHVRYTKRDGSVVDYRHASLGNIGAVLGQELGAEGLAFRWHTKQEEGRVIVTCILSHELGHSESVTLSSAPDDSGGKNSIQAVGSAVSYLQRYTLLAVTGTATSEIDDDGRGTDPQTGDSGDNGGGKTDGGRSGETVEYITDARFEELCTDKLDPEDQGRIIKMGWKSLVTSGKKTAEELIAWAGTKGNLSEAQQNTIRGWEKRGK